MVKEGADVRQRKILCGAQVTLCFTCARSMGVRILLFLYLTIASTILATAKDTTKVCENLHYIVRVKIINFPPCEKYPKVGLAEFKIDSILYFRDSFVFKSVDHFIINARYLIYLKKDASFVLDSIYTVNISLNNYYSTFQLINVFENDLVIIEDHTCVIPYYNPEYRYSRSRIKDFFNKLIYSEDEYGNLPRDKKFIKRKPYTPKYLNCLPGYKHYYEW